MIKYNDNKNLIFCTNNGKIQKDKMNNFKKIINNKIKLKKIQQKENSMKFLKNNVISKTHTLTKNNKKYSKNKKYQMNRVQILFKTIIKNKTKLKLE